MKVKTSINLFGCTYSLKKISHSLELHCWLLHFLQFSHLRLLLNLDAGFRRTALHRQFSVFQVYCGACCCDGCDDGGDDGHYCGDGGGDFCGGGDDGGGGGGNGAVQCCQCDGSNHYGECSHQARHVLTSWFTCVFYGVLRLGEVFISLKKS